MMDGLLWILDILKLDFCLNYVRYKFLFVKERQTRFKYTISSAGEFLPISIVIKHYLSGNVSKFIQLTKIQKWGKRGRHKMAASTKWPSSKGF